MPAQTTIHDLEYRADLDLRSHQQRHVTLSRLRSARGEDGPADYDLINSSNGILGRVKRK